MVAFIGFGFLFAILIGMPIAFGMGLAGTSWILLVEGLEPTILVRRVYSALGSFPLVAIPLFIMIGHLAERCGMLPDLVRWLQLLLGRTKGGMAYINVVGSMMFAGVSGTAVSDVASLGRVEIEMMRQAGYKVEDSAALTAATSILAPLIPPSVAMLIYAIAAGNVSIGGLFMASAVPGVVMGLGVLVMCWFKARRGNFGTMVERPTFPILVKQTFRMLPLLGLPLIIVGGIISGVFTVTESAAIGVMYTIFIGFAVTRQLRLRDLYDATIYSGIISSVLGMLLATGVIVSWILTRHRVMHDLADFLVSVTSDPTVFMALAALALVLLGMVMDATAMIIAMAPLLAPIAAQYGIDELHFGVVFVMSCMVGMITPPVGIILFMTAAIANISLESIARATVPYVIWIMLALLLVVIVPGFSLWLPRALGF